MSHEIKSQNFALAVGTIEPRKNYDLFLDSWNFRIKEQEKHLPLFIVGEKGWKVNRLIKRLVNNKKGVTWMGKVCDSSLHLLYSKANIFVSASKAEGFNLPVEEAISYGVPTIISRTDVHQELYSGRATFFEINSQESFCLAVNKALDAPKGEQTRVESSWEGIVEQATLSQAISKVIRL
jgi:glycosyltransferase involved in cell wall biosynthesis